MAPLVKVYLMADFCSAAAACFSLSSSNIGSFTLHLEWGQEVAMEPGSLIPSPHFLHRYDHHASPCGTAEGVAFEIGLPSLWYFGGGGGGGVTGDCPFDWAVA